MSPPRDPARVTIANVVTGERITALFNPAEFGEERAVTYDRHNIKGLSHRPLHYSGTENPKFSMTFWSDLDALESRGSSYPMQAIRGFRAFLRAATVPEAVSGTYDVAPPRLVLIWPRMVSITCVLTSVSFRYTDFANTGASMTETAICEFEEVFDERPVGFELRSF